MNKSKIAAIIFAVIALVAIIVCVLFAVKGLPAKPEQQPETETAEPVAQTEPGWVKYGDSYYKTNGSYVEVRKEKTITATVRYRDKDNVVIATAEYEITYLAAEITVEGQTITSKLAHDIDFDIDGSYFWNNGKLYNEKTGAAVDSVRITDTAYQHLESVFAEDYKDCVLAGIDKTLLITIY